jgi:hypothetical protein
MLWGLLILLLSASVSAGQQLELAVQGQEFQGETVAGCTIPELRAHSSCHYSCSRRG